MFDKLIEKIIEKNNPTVMGLDPKLEYIPEFIKAEAISQYGKTAKAAAWALFEFNKGLIDAAAELIPAIKPQSAYYEMYGFEGVKCLFDTINYAKSKGLYVITDAKRNDIGATAESYATAYLGETDIFGERQAMFNSDALTVNGYLGTDGLAPFVAACENFDKGIFVLAKTSNKSSGELQDLEVDGRKIYEIMGNLCETLADGNYGKYGYSSVGAVVGATYPEQLTELRKKLPHTFFLIPGYGAQGGGAKGLKGAFDENGLGGIVNSSRAIMCAYKTQKCGEKDYAKAAQREILRMKEDLLQNK
ncbi:MAG: orotidine-5'-phosphate decarboxylase [Ruminococcus sp.]|nr:orotidine-5'-phosphate decarboxylase [Ruminococcus sp.]